MARAREDDLTGHSISVEAKRGDGVAAPPGTRCDAAELGCGEGVCWENVLE